jgi:hypothetical protein
MRGVVTSRSERSFNSALYPEPRGAFNRRGAPDARRNESRTDAFSFVRPGIINGF